MVFGLFLFVLGGGAVVVTAMAGGGDDVFVPVLFATVILWFGSGWLLLRAGRLLRSDSPK